MKTYQRTLVLLFACVLLTGAHGFAQDAARKEELGKEEPREQLGKAQLGSDQPVVPLDARSSQQLYDEANSYLDKTYAEFNKAKRAYDPNLEANTKQEQKDLATRYAALLEARYARQTPAEIDL